MIAAAPPIPQNRTRPPMPGTRRFGSRPGVPVAPSRLESEIEDCAKSAATPNWDGYGAAPLPAEIVRRARRLARALPASLPLPDVAPAPSGSIDLEWRTGRDNCLSLCVGESGEVQYDGRAAGRPVAGSFPLSAVVPAEVAALIREVAG